MLLLRTGEQAWLLTGTKGNHEFTRAFYCVPKEGEEARYIVKDGRDRLGPSNLVHIAVDADGATFSWSCGRKTLVPQDYFQVTYQP